MKFYILLFSIIIQSNSFAGSPDSKGAHKLNTNIYEQEDEGFNISGKVRTIRNISDETEVFFDIENPKGAFTLPKSDKQPTFMKQLEKSRAPGGPKVNVKADKNRNIISVESE